MCLFPSNSGQNRHQRVIPTVFRNDLELESRFNRIQSLKEPPSHAKAVYCMATSDIWHLLAFYQQNPGQREPLSCWCTTTTQSEKHSLPLHLFIDVGLLCSTGNQTQGLTHARQVLHHWVESSGLGFFFLMFMLLLCSCGHFLSFLRAYPFISDIQFVFSLKLLDIGPRMWLSDKIVGLANVRSEFNT